MNESVRPSFITLHSALCTSFVDWRISVGDVSELARPAVFALAALASAWVFHDARRRAGFGVASVWAWALLTLLFPPAVLPLYLAARLFTRRAGAPESPSNEAAEKSEPASSETEAGAASEGSTSAPNETGATGGAPAVSAGREKELAKELAADSGLSEGGAVERAGGAPAGGPQARRGFAPTLLYTSALVLAGGLYFYADYRSFDAHLARAERAKIYGRPESAIGEYRAALRVREDSHTRKLLGLELLQAGRAEEALAELRAAIGGGGAPDASLHFHAAAALDALGRGEEAAADYRRFLEGTSCAPPPADERCELARARLRARAAPAR